MPNFIVEKSGLIYWGVFAAIYLVSCLLAHEALHFKDRSYPQVFLMMLAILLPIVWLTKFSVFVN